MNDGGMRTKRFLPLDSFKRGIQGNFVILTCEWVGNAEPLLVWVEITARLHIYCENSVINIGRTELGKKIKKKKKKKKKFL